MTVGILFVLAYFSSLLITQYVYFNFGRKQYEDRILTVAHNFAAVCYQPIVHSNYVELYRAIRTFLNEDDLETVYILDRNGHPLIQENTFGQAQDSSVFRFLQQIQLDSLQIPYLKRFTGHKKIVVYPIRMDFMERPWGYAVLIFNPGEILLLLQKTGYTSTLISLVVLLLGLILLQKISHSFTSPAKELMRGTEEVIRGNFDYQIKVDDEAEFGQLARKFNEMVLKLNYYYKQKTLLNKKLNQYNAELEEKVRERTKQLIRIQEEVISIFHQIPVGLLVVDLEGKVRWHNREFLNILEEDPEISLREQYFKDIDAIEGCGLHAVINKLYQSTEKHVLQVDFQCKKSGTTKIVEIASQPLMGTNDNLEGTIFIFKDITRETALEKKLAQEQRLESIGKIAGGIAHDFNNVLAVILPNAQLLKMQLRDHPQWVHALENIEKAAEQGAALTSQILAFSRGKSRENLEILNMNEVVENFTRMFRRVLDRKIEIVMDLESHLNNVKADRNQIEQVLMNLSVNARDAMPNGGKIIYRTYNVVIHDDAQPILSAKLKKGEYVCLEVQDTGMGIPPEYLDRIFDPFFSSKKTKGTGLGLSVVYGIIKGHKGVIDVSSTPGEGSSFRIYLPITREKVSHKATRSVRLQTGTGTLLIVDDEKMIQETLTGMLESLNYTVITANNGKEAVEIFRKEQGKINAIIMDIQMPVMDGVEAAASILKINPGARIIFTSGYADPARFEELKKMGYQYFLKKPYKIGVLSDIIKQALGENGKTS